jgi:uncharacterized membrane protein
MNSAHLHLLLNHFPTIGTIIGLGLFLLSLVQKNDDLKRASLAVFFLIALVSFPTYLSGAIAQEAIARQPGVSQPLIGAHQDAALLALLFMEVTGAVAWVGLWQYRRSSRPAGWTSGTVLLLSVVTVGLMANAANLGGEIRHPEIRSGEEAAVRGTVGLSTAAVSSFIHERAWAWPAAETVHFIGLCLLISVVLLVNLRMLGMMKNVSFAALHGLLPWGVVGFGIMAASGLLFFIAAPDQYTQNPAFYWKVIFILLTAVNVLYLTVFDEAWAVGAGTDAPLTAKMLAGSAIFLWLGIIFWGRLMPFLGLHF